MRTFQVFCLAVAACFAYPAGAADTAPNFRLLDQDGDIFELYRLDEATAVALVAFDPADNALLDALPASRKKRGRKGAAAVEVALVVTDTTATREQLSAIRKNARTSAPMLLDSAGSVSRAFGLRAPGDIVLIDPAADWKILGHTRDKAALTGDGATPVQPLVLASATPDISYSRDIVPILETRCVNCHNEGGIGPFAMSSHKKVLGWAEMMQETILTKRMPPWHADPAYQHFQNSLALTPEEERTLMAWLAAGAPKDESEPDPLAESGNAPTELWAMGEPDHIVRMPEAVAIPATGTIDYKYFYVPAGLSENKWVRGVEVRSGNRALVHHALIFVEYPPEYAHVQPETDSGLGGFFASFLPGSPMKPFPEGTAQFVPAGSTFIFQMHYNAIGKPATDQSEMGLYFAESPPDEVLQVGAISTTDFKIKPRMADQAISLSGTIDEAFRLWGVLPHMHYRGQEFRYTLDEPGKPAETLLSVPWYQFDWQPMYWYDAPKTIPAGATLSIDGAFDNSKYNPLNPDPNDTVYFGEQSYDEMFIGYLALSRPYDPKDFTPANADNEFDEPISEAMLPGTVWDVGEARPLRFLEDGVLKLAWFKGSWKLEGDQLIATIFDDTFVVDIVNDNMYVQGQRMVRLK